MEHDPREQAKTHALFSPALLQMPQPSLARTTWHPHLHHSNTVTRSRTPTPMLHQANRNIYSETATYLLISNVILPLHT